MAKNLRKTIKKREIIKNISFEIRRGEIFGFLGPNGSGKTTTIRMLTGMIKPTSGSVTIMGYDVQVDPQNALRHLGAIVENPAPYKYMTGWQNLMQCARIAGQSVSTERLEWAVRMVELDQRIHDIVGTYSLGMKQRLGIAMALLTGPSLMILDEPTNGMDPSGIKDMRNLIRKLVKETGLSVFISSHLLSEVEQLCDRVLIIDGGTSIVTGRVEELASAVENSEFQLTTEDGGMLKKGIELLRQAGYRVHEETGRINLLCKKEEIPHLVNQLYQNHVNVLLIHRKDSGLEDYFLAVTKGEESA